jgi:hypothetical protein
MARFHKRRIRSGFRVSDILRLMSMMGMLCVVAMVVFRARDASMWKWAISDSRPSNGPPEKVLAAAQSPVVTRAQQDESHPLSKMDAEPASDDEAKPKPVVEPKTEVAVAEKPVRVSHLDAEEWKQAEYEFQLVEDKTALDHFEMQAYWRLLNWIQSQSGKELAERADQDVSFTDFVQRPGKMRGKLCRLKLHMLRSKRYEAGNNRYGFKWLYEVWGYTNDSNPYPYVIVFPEWPKGMPLGSNLAEEATVDAYFLKLMKYEAHDGKMRMSPLLLGRLVWHPNPLREARGSGSSADGIWTLVFVAGAAAMAFLGFKVFRIVFGTPNVPVPLASTTDPSALEGWIRGDEPDQAPAFLIEDYQPSEDVFVKESGHGQDQ